MRTWAILLGGLVIWAVHFFGIYAVASIFLTSMLSRILALVLTALCLAANAWLLRLTLPMLRRESADELGRWVALVGALGAALSFLSVLWQGLPALLS